MRTNKNRWLFLVFGILLALSACAAPGVSERVPIQTAPPLAPAEGEPLITVYLSDTIPGGYMGGVSSALAAEAAGTEIEALLTRMTEIVRQSGFCIAFETLPAQDGVAYNEALLAHLPTLAKGNTAFVLPAFDPDAWGGLDANAEYAAQYAPVYEAIAQNEYARAVSEAEWTAYAPTWQSACAQSDAPDALAVPTGIATDPIDRSVLLLSDETAAAYGKKINTLSDIEKFAKWARKNQPDKTPLLIPYGIASWWNTHEYTNLLCGEYGFFPVDTLLGSGYGFVAPIDADGDACGYVPIEEQSFYKKGLARLLALRDQGYADLKCWYQSNDTTTMRWEEYSAVVLNSSYWQRSELYESLYGRKKTTGAPEGYFDQTVYVLYDGVLPDTRAEKSARAAGYSYIGCETSDEGVAEWLRFLEWTHGTEGALRTILYGVEGVEYTLENGRYRARASGATRKRRL